MHQTSLGGVLVDYLTGETRAVTTYEDLRQALARYLVEEKGHARESLRPRYAIGYEIDGGRLEREADIAVFCASGQLCMLLIFCAGQINTYTREALAMARLALPEPAPLVAVTDTREAALLAVPTGVVLARGLDALPGKADMPALAGQYRRPALDAERRAKESRILHAYTGFLKICCAENCILP